MSSSDSWLGCYKASDRIQLTEDVALPKESDLGQVGLQRRQICPRSASFNMVDDKWLLGVRRSIGNSFSAARLNDAPLAHALSPVVEPGAQGAVSNWPESRSSLVAVTSGNRIVTVVPALG